MFCFALYRNNRGQFALPVGLIGSNYLQARLVLVKEFHATERTLRTITIN